MPILGFAYGLRKECDAGFSRLSAAVVLLNFPSVFALGFESASWEGRMMDCT